MVFQQRVEMRAYTGVAIPKQYRVSAGRSPRTQSARSQHAHTLRFPGELSWAV